MSSQQGTNNVPPAVPVNLQMWPSAPQEREGKKDSARERERETGDRQQRERERE